MEDKALMLLSLLSSTPLILDSSSLECFDGWGAMAKLPPKDKGGNRSQQAIKRLSLYMKKRIAKPIPDYGNSSQICCQIAL